MLYSLFVCVVLLYIVLSYFVLSCLIYDFVDRIIYKSKLKAICSEGQIIIVVIMIVSNYEYYFDVI